MPRRIEAIHDITSSQDTFQWSCRPIFIWMNIIGIPINLSNKGFIQCNLLFCYSILSIFKDLGISAFYIMELFTDEQYSALMNISGSSTLYWNNIMISINDRIFTLGIHFVLMASTLVNWPNLFSVLHRMEILYLFSSTDYRRFRNICSWAVCFIILVNDFQLKLMIVISSKFINAGLGFRNCYVLSPLEFRTFSSS